jgi:KOW motif
MCRFPYLITHTNQKPQTPRTLTQRAQTTIHPSKLQLLSNIFFTTRCHPCEDIPAMQKILRRAALARRSIEKRRAKREDIEARNESKKIALHRNQYASREYQHEKLPIKELEQDWDLGPLAPRREAGLGVKKYGFVHNHVLDIPKAGRRDVEARKMQFEHGMLRNVFVKDDRVVVIRGLDQGRIGKIEKIYRENGTVVVQGAREVRFLQLQDFIII